MAKSQTMELVKIIKNRIGIIILFGLIFALASFYAFILTQKRYVSKTDFLIVQDQMENQDFYSLSKSAEYLGGVLSEAVYSSVFIEELKNTNKVEASYFALSERDLIKKWKKAVEIERSPNLGILKVSVYDNNRNTAIGISQGISEIMASKNYLFRGKVNLDVRILSGPLTERNPSLMDVVVVVVGGFILGAFLYLMFVYYKFVKNIFQLEEDEEYLRSLREIR